jgi:hypothetical protein
VKALPHPVELTTIALCSGGFDVATGTEVDHLQQLGLRMDRCIHTNPIKKPADIDQAYGAGIRAFVVENPCDADKFAGRPDDIELLVRLAFRNPTAKGPVVQIRRRPIRCRIARQTRHRSRSAICRVQLPRRQPNSVSRAVSVGTARHTRSCRTHSADPRR